MFHHLERTVGAIDLCRECRSRPGGDHRAIQGLGLLAVPEHGRHGPVQRLRDLVRIHLSPAQRVNIVRDPGEGGIHTLRKVADSLAKGSLVP